jgi:hypothetical protein
MATKKQIPVLAGEITKNQECFNALSEADAQAAILDMPSFIAMACVAWTNRNVIATATASDQIAQTDAEQLADWRRFYVEVLQMPSDNLPDPTLPTLVGFGWLVVIRKGLTLNKVLETMRTHMKVYSYIGDDLDKGVPKNDRTADRDYCVRIRTRIEADEELRMLSANQVSEGGIKGITLLERLVLELFYFWKTGSQTDLNKRHLDVENVTLCSGSRYSDGYVPRVGWHVGHGEVCIRWYYPGYSDGHIRTRAVQLAAA